MSGIAFQKLNGVGTVANEQLNELKLISDNTAKLLTPEIKALFRMLFPDLPVVPYYHTFQFSNPVDASVPAPIGKRIFGRAMIVNQLLGVPATDNTYCGAVLNIQFEGVNVYKCSAVAHGEGIMAMPYSTGDVTCFMDSFFYQKYGSSLVTASCEVVVYGFAIPADYPQAKLDAIKDINTTMTLTPPPAPEKLSMKNNTLIDRVYSHYSNKLGTETRYTIKAGQTLYFEKYDRIIVGGHFDRNALSIVKTENGVAAAFVNVDATGNQFYENGFGTDTQFVISDFKVVQTVNVYNLSTAPQNFDLTADGGAVQHLTSASGGNVNYNLSDGVFSPAVDPYAFIRYYPNDFTTFVIQALTAPSSRVISAASPLKRALWQPSRFICSRNGVSGTFNPILNGVALVMGNNNRKYKTGDVFTYVVDCPKVKLTREFQGLPQVAAEISYFVKGQTITINLDVFYNITLDATDV